MAFEYDLNTGYPDTSILVPFRQLADLTQEMLAANRGTQYTGDLMGPLALREQLASFFKVHSNADVDPAELVITSGAIAATDLVCRAASQPGDVVVVEDPTFYYMISILKMSHVDVVSVPMTSQGMDLERLAELCEQYGERLKVVYTIPSFHNPTGINASAEHRQALVDLARERNLTIIEDATYQWLYFDSPPPPLCRQFDPEGEHVVSVGSVSKILMPSLRMGWAWSSSKRARELVKFKGDAAASGLTSGIVTDYLRHGYLDSQLNHARNHYGERCQILCEALEEHLPEWVQWDRPQGGYFVWATLPEELSATAIRAAANAGGADFMPGKLAFVDPVPDRYMRICFTMMDEARLRKGAEIIGQAVRDVAAGRNAG